ncbi:hypothetical protein HY502_03055 [Candidatus Woesebacteria bacterium]|nr:hypothetical protein [Candidatus Woesebacteria bacterium]
MAERLQPKDFQVDPYRMAILESGWLIAMDTGDSVVAAKYISEGLTHRFHLSRPSADAAARYLLAALTTEDIKEEERNLFRHHETLSKTSGIGFDPHLATKTCLEMERNGIGTVGQASKYLSILYGGLSEEKLLASTGLRARVINRYYAIKENGTKKETIKAFGDLVSGLTESYELLNEALKNSSTNLADPLKQ